MTDIFLKLFNMSITALWLILAVIVIRLLLKKAPKAIHCILWGIVGLRLLLPFSFESVLSLIPSKETIPSEAVYSTEPVIHSGINALNSTVNPIITETLTPTGTWTVTPMERIVNIASIVWIIGVILLIGYSVISYISIKIKLRESVETDGIRYCDRINTPFILGLIKPHIYVPSNIDSNDITYVIAHEKAHIKRLDHIWKPIGFILLTVYWFNPFIWVAYILLCRDIELACDEKVISTMEPRDKISYSNSLINCSIPRRMISACPLAFGETSVKHRIKNILNYKKPTFWIIIVAIVACIAVTVFFLTDPVDEQDIDNSNVVKTVDIGSELDGLSLAVKSVSIHVTNESFIEIEFKNNTDKPMTIGEEFYLYELVDDEWIDLRRDPNYYWHKIAYEIPANDSFTKKYDLNGMDDFNEPCKLRFETKVNGTLAWVEFEYGDADLTNDVQFEVVELIYDQGSFSYVQTPEAAPNYQFYGGVLFERGRDDTLWLNLGMPEEIDLTEENFDKRFYDEYWKHEQSIEEFRHDINRAWQLKIVRNEINELYLITEHNDGTYYLGYGYYNQLRTSFLNTYDNSFIRWFYKTELKSIAEPTKSYVMNVAATSPSIDGEIKAGCLNADKMLISSVQHLPIYKFESKAELDNFASVFPMDGALGFPAPGEIYEEDFFTDNVLLAVYVHASNGTDRYILSEVYCDDGDLVVHVLESDEGEDKIDQEVAWFLLVGIPRNELSDVMTYDADLNNY